MTVRLITETQRYIGTSGETKPDDAKPGAEFFETDTGITKLFDGADWSALPSSGSLSSPAALPGLALWLDASQLDLEDDDKVALWPDLSGNGYDATQTGTPQVETAVVVETVAGVLTAGDATVTVTADGMTNSPKDVVVALATNDTEAQVATKFRAALELDADVSAFFDVGGTGVDVVLTALVAAADDATMNIAYADTTSVGLADDATSNDTTAGVAAADAQPTYKTNIQNGRAVVRFDPAIHSQYLLFPTATSLFRDVAQVTIMVVARIYVDVPYTMDFDAGIAVGNNPVSTMQLIPSSFSTFLYNDYSDNVNADNNVLVAATGSFLFIGIAMLDAANGFARAVCNYQNDDASVVSITPGNTPDADHDPPVLGGNYNNLESGADRFDLCEQAVYLDYIPNIREQRLLMEYAATRWGR